MKEQYKTIAALGAIIALSGVLTVNLTLGFFGNDNVSATSSITSGYMTGHIVLTAHDADGNIKAYRQSDNIIVNQGEDCAIRHLFSNGTSGGSNNCGPDAGGVARGKFTYIAIGNQTNLVAATDSNLQLNREHNQTSSGFNRAQADSVVLTAATGTTPAKVVLTKAFTLASGASCGLGTSTCSVSESGLFNSTFAPNTDALFARQTFTAIPVDVGESLTVEWTVNIGGTASFTTPEET